LIQKKTQNWNKETPKLDKAKDERKGDEKSNKNVDGDKKVDEKKNEKQNGDKNDDEIENENECDKTWAQLIREKLDVPFVSKTNAKWLAKRAEKEEKIEAQKRREEVLQKLAECDAKNKIFKTGDASASADFYEREEAFGRERKLAVDEWHRNMPFYERQIMKDFANIEATCPYNRSEYYSGWNKHCPHTEQKYDSDSRIKGLCKNEMYSKAVRFLINILMQKKRNAVDGDYVYETHDSEVILVPETYPKYPNEPESEKLYRTTRRTINVLIIARENKREYRIWIKPGVSQDDACIGLIGHAFNVKLDMHNTPEFYALFYKMLSAFCQDSEERRLFNSYHTESGLKVNSFNIPSHQGDRLGVDDVSWSGVHFENDKTFSQVDSETTLQLGFELKTHSPTVIRNFMKTAPVCVRIAFALSKNYDFWKETANTFNRFGFTNGARGFLQLKDARLDNFYQHVNEEMVLYFALFDKWNWSNTFERHPLARKIPWFKKWKRTLMHNKAKAKKADDKAKKEADVESIMKEMDVWTSEHQREKEKKEKQLKQKQDKELDDELHSIYNTGHPDDEGENEQNSFSYGWLYNHRSIYCIVPVGNRVLVFSKSHSGIKLSGLDCNSSEFGGEVPRIVYLLQSRFSMGAK